MNLYTTFTADLLKTEDINLPGIQKCEVVDLSEMPELAVGDILIINWDHLTPRGDGHYSVVEATFHQWIEKNLEIFCDIKIVLVSNQPRELENQKSAGFLVVDLFNFQKWVTNIDVELKNWKNLNLHNLLDKIAPFKGLHHNLKQVDPVYMPEALEDRFPDGYFYAPTKEQIENATTEEIIAFTRIESINEILGSFTEVDPLTIVDKGIDSNKGEEKLEDVFSGRIAISAEIPKKKMDHLILGEVWDWEHKKGDPEEYIYVIKDKRYKTCCEFNAGILVSEEEIDDRSPHDGTCPLHIQAEGESARKRIERLLVKSPQVAKWVEKINKKKESEVTRHHQESATPIKEKEELVNTQHHKRSVAPKKIEKGVILFIDDKKLKYNEFNKQWKTRGNCELEWCHSYTDWKQIFATRIKSKGRFKEDFQAILIDIVIDDLSNQKKGAELRRLKEYFPKGYNPKDVDEGQLIVAELSKFIKDNKIEDYPPIIVQSSLVPASQIDYFLFGEKILADDFFEIKRGQYGPLIDRLYPWVNKKETLLEWRMLKKYFASGNEDMKRMREQVIRYAGRSQPILIRGKKGSGKSFVEKAIFHLYGKKKDKQSEHQVLSCAAISENLLKANLFGMDKGATDVRPMLGVMRQAAGFRETISDSEETDEEDTQPWGAKIDLRTNKFLPPGANFQLSNSLIKSLPEIGIAEESKLFLSLKGSDFIVDNLDELWPELKKKYDNLPEYLKSEIDNGISIQFEKEGFIFLDEFHHFPLNEQSALLRVFQTDPSERFVQPDQAKTEYAVQNVHFILGSNAILEKMVRNKELLPDLFDRINALTIEIPTLKERIDDIPLIGESIINKMIRYEKDLSKSWKDYSVNDALKQICEESKRKKYQWDSNIRGLEKFLYRLMVMHDDLNPIDEKAVSSFLSKFQEEETKLISTTAADDEVDVPESKKSSEKPENFEKWEPAERLLLFLSQKSLFLAGKESTIYYFKGQGKSLIDIKNTSFDDEFFELEIPPWLIRKGGHSFNDELGKHENRQWAAWLLFIYHIGHLNIVETETAKKTIKWICYYLKNGKNEKEYWDLSSKDDNLPLEFKNSENLEKSVTESFIKKYLPHWWAYYQSQIT
jgi:DNA-binding NtrC family response regulator